MRIKVNKNKNGGIKKNKLLSKSVACAVTVALSTSISSVYSVGAVERKPSSQEVQNKVEMTSGNHSLQPTGNGYGVKTLLEWTPESDPNARYNRASIKIQDRFTGQVVNPNANKEAKIMNCALTNPQSDNAPSQGGDTENAYAFSYWQYVDSYVYWGGTSKGIFLPPTADVIDSGHKNGVPVLGTVGFPWGSGDGYVEQVREFLAKDENGKFPVADKMIEMVRFYGFDGWFINQETYGCGKKDADLMVEFFTYMREKAPDIRLGWYDSMTTAGSVNYQDSLTPVNVGFFQNKGKTLMDEFFLNYNWNKSKVDMSVKTAKEAGRSQYDVYAGVEVQQNAYNDRFPVDYLLDKEGKLKLSLAMYCPNSTFSMSKDIDDFYKHDQKFWVGPTGDPANTNTSEKWVGLANYVADKSAINSLPFVTNFNLGHGQDYYIDGKLSRDKEWNNRSIQEYLPTWRWIVESKGSKLSPNFDRTDAYNGGSSLKVEGNLEDKNPNHIKLYSTKLEIKDDTTNLTVVYKTPLSEDNMKIGLCFGENYDEENFEFFDVENGTPGEWNTATISLADHVGKTVSAISLKFDSSEDISNFKINIGSISIEEKDKDIVLPATSKITLDQSLLHNSQKAEAKIYWADVENADFYEIYRVKPSGNREYVGSTYNDSYYIPPFYRYENEESFSFEVVAVDKNYNRGEKASLDFKWRIGANDTEVPKEEKMVNVALNKPVKASTENSGEPAHKAVDGTVENNSKWCTTSGMYGGWLEVDLGEEKTIQRWVTMHGEAGGEAKNTNTKDFRLQVSYDERKTYVDVDKVVENDKGVVDRNLDTPVKGRYFRIVIDHPGLSPWNAIRLYEFQLFENKYVEKTENIALNSVRAFNNKGAKDKVIARNVTSGQVVSIYKNIKDTEALSSKVAGEDGIANFENLDLGEKEGRIFFTVKENGKEESIKLSVAYENETWDVTPILNNFKISEYHVDSRMLANYSYGAMEANCYYGVIEAGNLKPGDVVSYYENEKDEFPTRVSVAATVDNVLLEGIRLNKDGGKVTLQVSREGMRTTPKFKLIYTSEKETSLEKVIDETIVVSKVSNLKSSEVTKNTVQLKWDAPNSIVGLTEYVVYKDGKEFTKIPVGTTEVVIDGLRNNTIYGFKLSAKYSNGEESKPKSINVRTKK